VKEPGSGKTKYLMGPFLAVAVLIGIALLASGRLRGSCPFIVRRDRSAEAVGDQSFSFVLSTEVEADASVEETVDQPPARGKTASLEHIEGIGPAYAENLKAQGLKTTADLLTAGSGPKGREGLAATTGISGRLILRWVNQADLFRIKGVGGEYAELLEAAGVDTVPELARRRADNLSQKMAEVNEQKKLVRRLPTENQVAGWIESAKGLPRMVTY
jgi:predicted flap endonuclease-1-like 5' DNA nuclease